MKTSSANKAKATKKADQQPESSVFSTSPPVAHAVTRSNIIIEGARQHNLKNINVTIPRDKLVVVCGPSGSGKSTLAFDIVYAEGQRRYVESLSAYARQFLPKMDKPLVDKIEGLSPAISLEQQTAGRNPRSTVGTVTEIYDFLRVFFARLGKTYCTECGTAIEARSADEIIADILELGEGTRVILLAPLVEMQKGTHADRFKKLKADGFVRVRVATLGEKPQILNIDDVPPLDKNKKHTIDLVVDRLVIRDDLRTRLSDSVELALRHGQGRLLVSVLSQNADEAPQPDIVHATDSACPKCHHSMPAPSPQLFSFNSPQGACPQCLGIGTVATFDPQLIAPDTSLSLRKGALAPLSQPTTMERLAKPLEALGKRHGFTLDTPLKDFSEDAHKALFVGEPGGVSRNGSLRRNFMGGTSLNRDSMRGEARETVHGHEADVSTSHWPGVMYLLEQRMQNSEAWSEILSRYSYVVDCPSCKGTRLRPEALAVRVEDQTIQSYCAMPIDRALAWIKERTFHGRFALVADPLLKELTHRLTFLVDVGLDYISLGRAMMTLSGGEAQRIRLASQLGSGLVGVTYVLDEPSIGLHPRDNERLIQTLRSLQMRGNTVLVVEHDEATIREADTILELGPGSGSQGGELVFAGTVEELFKSSESLTAKYMRGELKIPMPDERREPSQFINLRNVTTNNLKGIDCDIPLGLLTCVTGVSGSGKSSLVIDTLYKHVAMHCGLKVDQPGTLAGIDNLDLIERIVSIDQSPIGRTPRSNPATYTKIFDEIRNIFAMTPDAKRRGYTASRFSFNVTGGRCETCKGDGQIRVEMHFLPDIFVTCDVCKGHRFNRETLEVRYKDLNIADVLDLSVREAREFFANYPALERRLAVLEDVGLDYIRLGQPATTLSGGEAQRIKISRELGKRSLPGTLYILDEPTTGLHMHEVGKLVTVLHHLVEKGASVVVIEHNTDVILASDYVIDLGPGGGENGGSIISRGTPEAIMADPASITGRFLTEERRLRRRQL